jgi:5-methylcytosine-specific restriction endonuclease McrA
MASCVQCGASFQPKREGHFFCSDKCRRAARGGIYRVQRALAMMRDGYVCTECGSEDHLECHHIQPLCYGGNHDLTNLQTLCRKCHKNKHRTWRRTSVNTRNSEGYDNAA